MSTTLSIGGTCERQFSIAIIGEYYQNPETNWSLSVQHHPEHKLILEGKPPTRDMVKDVLGDVCLPYMIDLMHTLSVIAHNERSKQ